MIRVRLTCFFSSMDVCRHEPSPVGDGHSRVQHEQHELHDKRPVDDSNLMNWCDDSMLKVPNDMRFIELRPNSSQASNQKWN